MSFDPMLPSVPGVSARWAPSSKPTVTPFAPGNVPNRLSKVRFSLIRKTTCLIGHDVARIGPLLPGAAGEVDDGAFFAAVGGREVVRDGCDAAPEPHAAVRSTTTSR